MLGISARLDGPLGGHVSFAILTSILYGLTYSFALISEIAYDFDRLGHSAAWLSVLVFIWIVTTSVSALSEDWKLTLRGSSRGLWISMFTVGISAALVYAMLSFFLPNVPITRMDTGSQTAQGAYLKGMVYILPLAFLLWLLPFHFVLAIQRELQESRHRLAFALLSGDNRAVSPPGAIYVGLKSLAGTPDGSFPSVGSPHRGPFRPRAAKSVPGIFTLFIYLRWFAYFGLGLICLLWYARALNELRRECLSAQRVKF